MQFLYTNFSSYLFIIIIILNTAQKCKYPKIFYKFAPSYNHVFKVAATSAILTGNYDSVSGASTEITSPTNVSGTEGENFTYRITTSPRSASNFFAENLPDGLSMGTGVLKGFIIGIPTSAGTSKVKLTASKPGYGVVYKTITIQINSENDPDKNPPVITLNGQSNVTIEAGSEYIDLGATAIDEEDGDLSGSIQLVGEVKANKPGSYELKYNVKDSSGNAAQTVTRTVAVVDTVPPVISLVGDSMITIEVGGSYEDKGATAQDVVDGDLSDQIKVSGEVVANRVGNYQLTYAVTDAAGNVATTKIRTIAVIDTAPPVITLNGQSNVTIEAGSEYIDLGATAIDEEDGDLSGSIQLVGEVKANKPGSYELKYNVKDSSGNAAQTVTRTVAVVDTVPPVISLVGDSMITIEVGGSYEDKGATAQDVVDGDLSDQIKVSGEVVANRVGNYQLTYAVTDAAGNVATEKIRSVRIIKLNPTIVWQNPKAITYGDRLSEIQLNPTSNVDGTFQFSHDQQDILSVSSHVLKADFYPINQDKYLVTSKEVTIIVEKAPLTISVDSVSRLTNQQNPKFIIGYDGFVNNETKDDLTSEAVASTTATAGSEAGKYPITLSGAESDNYEITYQKGVLTVVDKLRLTLEILGSGKVKILPNKELFDTGDKVKLQAVPSKGYAFTEWEGTVKSSDNPLEITINEDTTIKAKFAKLIKFTGVIVEGKGDILLAPDLNMYPAYSRVNVLAVPAKNHEFVKWTMKGFLLSKDNPLTSYKVPGSDMEIEAHFKYVKPAEPEIVEITDFVNVPFGFSFNTEEGTSYEVQASDDFQKWQQLRKVNGTGEVVKFVDIRKAFYQQQYYRIRVVQ